MVANRRLRGFSMTEGLIASSIMAVAVTAMFGLWSGMFRRIGQAREAGQAAQLVRAEVERAKVFGMDNLPMGNYNSTTGSATWSGSFSPTAAAGAGAWVSGGFSYFDESGVRLTSTTDSALKLQATITDTKVLPKTGGYSFQLESRRSFVVTAWDTSDNSVVFQVGTIIVPGGL